MRRALLLALALTTAPVLAQTQPKAAAPMPKPAYPVTARVDQVDEQFGVKVADPYRWLENDVRTDPRVAAWVAEQNKVTDAYLATLPGRDIFKARLRQLIDFERFGMPRKKGGKYFYTRNSGLQNQSPVYVRDTLNGEGRLLIDPNTLSKDGATALGEWVPSEDGTKLLYTIQDGGTDWRIVRVLDVATGQTLPDTIEWSKFSGYSWARDGSGFYYSRFPAPADGQKFQALNENQAVYFHRIGTPQSADTLIYATPDRPKLGHSAFVTEDGKWLVISTTEGTDPRNLVAVLDLTKPGAKPVALIDRLEDDWNYAGNVGSTFYWKTDKDAPRSRVVAMDVTRGPAVRDVIPQDAAVLQGAGIVDDQLVASYLVDVKTEVRRYATDGKLLGKVDLPGIGSAGFTGDQGDAEAFYSFSSYNRPATIYRYDMKTGRSTVWAAPKVAFDPGRFEVAQVFYTSKDGTRVPMFVVKRKDVTGPAPTLLYAYGGFNQPSLPGFSPTRLAWLEQGGVLAVANIRGGGEYGKPWHDGGRLANKQNVFDDFIAAGEYLKARKIAAPQGLAIQGGSNGGLLVGAVANQRPDLFQAALPAVGVMDMLRFDRFTAGRYWVDDYGYPSKEADFRTLYAYSPYHNIKGGRSYPAILVTTADTDDRVVPGHSFKYTAALQAADIGDKPHLARIETRAGHGSGKPTDKIIEEAADLWAFAARWTGLTVKPQ